MLRGLPVYVLFFFVATLCDCKGDGIIEIGIPSPEYLLVDNFPAWSPDQNTVAYHRQVPSTAGPPGLYLINIDGTSNRFLLEGDLFFPRDLRFSPDGLRLSMTIDFDVHLLAVGDTTTWRITESGSRAQQADWSPDGRKLVYETTGGLLIFDLDTETATVLINDGAPLYAIDPRWAPSDRIVFASGARTAGQDIFTVRPDGSDLRRLTDTYPHGALASDPRWFDGGDQILFSWLQDGRRHTRIMGPDGANQRAWPVAIGFHDAISPDGQRIVTPAAQDDSTKVLFTRDMLDADGRTLRQLTSYDPP